MGGYLEREQGGVCALLTPQSSPRALLACGSECPYILLVSSWEPETHTSTSDAQGGPGTGSSERS